jgi:RimJ/RimL family protein N-acetyltransferase
LGHCGSPPPAAPARHQPASEPAFTDPGNWSAPPRSLPLPPDRVDLETGWQLAPGAWGNGFAAEAGHAVAHYAFKLGVDEIFAVVRPRNARGATTTQRVGMEWLGETDK